MQAPGKRAPSPLISVLLYGTLIGAVLLWSPILQRGLVPEPRQLAFLGGALLLWLFGYQFCGGRFVRPRWKQLGKLVVYLLFSWLLLRWMGSWALLFILGHQALGMLGHVVICRKHGIDWRTCQPEEKYLALTEKWARGDFS